MNIKKRLPTEDISTVSRKKIDRIEQKVKVFNKKIQL